jgi:hypothetical protein
MIRGITRATAVTIITGNKTFRIKLPYVICIILLVNRSLTNSNIVLTPILTNIDDKGEHPNLRTI